MELYNFYFGALALVSVALAYRGHRGEKRGTADAESLALPAGDDKGVGKKFQMEYFGVYGLVVAADWLQVWLSQTP